MKNYFSGTPRFSVTRNFFIYLVMVFGALIFTQALRSPLSSMMFKFLLILPVVCLLYSLIGLGAIKVYVLSEETTVEKYSPLDYEFRIINASPLPFPFIDTVISLPHAEGVRCEERMYGISLYPGGAYPLGNITKFKYRGVYEVGVSCIFIYDFFKMFRIRFDVDIFSNIHVMPRRLLLERPLINSVTDIPTDLSKSVRGSDHSEIGNIRQYIAGDALKNVHWKLSSKTQDLQVKDYITNTGRHVYIICDFAKRNDDTADIPIIKGNAADKKNKAVKKKQLKFKLPVNGGQAADNLDDDTDAKETADTADADGFEEIFDSHDSGFSFDNLFNSSIANIIKHEYISDMDEFCADGVVELAVASVYSELRAGNDCTLMYFDIRSEDSIAVHDLTSAGDFESIFKSFASTPICPRENSVMRLSSLIGESLNVTIRIITSAIDSGTISEYAAMPSMFGGAGSGCVTEVILFNPEQRYSDLSARRDYIDLCKSRLAQNGVVLTEIKSEQITGDGRILI